MLRSSNARQRTGGVYRIYARIGACPFLPPLPSLPSLPFRLLPLLLSLPSPCEGMAGRGGGERGPGSFSGKLLKFYITAGLQLV